MGHDAELLAASADVGKFAYPRNGLLDERLFNGNPDDTGPFAHSGSVIGSASLTTDQKNIANQAYLLSGGYIESTGTNLGLNGTTTLSVISWFKTSASGNIVLANKHLQTSGGWDTFILMLVNGQLRLSVQNRSLNQFPVSLTGNTFNDNQWHLAISSLDVQNGDSTDFNITIDDNNEAFNFTSFGYNTNFILDEVTSTLGIGARPPHITNLFPFPGSISDSLVYNRKFIPAEKTAIWEGTKP